MSKFAVLISTVVLIVVFQNCAQTNQVPFLELGNPQNTTYNKIPLVSADRMSLWNMEQDFGQILDLNLVTGRMQVIEGAGASTEYCLTSSEQTQLHTILVGAEICEPTAATEISDKVCTMEYRYPYASLVIDNKEEVKLGEKSNGCDVPVDLCGEKSKQLKDFVSAVMMNLKAHSCL